MRAQNTANWSWPDLLNELKCHGIIIKPESYPWDGPPDEQSGGDIIILYSIRDAETIAERFDISYSFDVAPFSLSTWQRPLYLILLEKKQ